VDNDVDLDTLRSTVDYPTKPAESTDEDEQRAGSSTELLELRLGKAADAPLCMTCGTKMRPSGSCYLCEGCGSTSGCS
jgi:ribonucleoside-diphosphate reductase alpha chain